MDGASRALASTHSVVRGSGFFAEVLFDAHILEFAGFKDFAAILTFDELRILFPRNNLHARMFALLIHAVVSLGGRVEIRTVRAHRNGAKLGRAAGILAAP